MTFSALCTCKTTLMDIRHETKTNIDGKVASRFLLGARSRITHTNTPPTPRRCGTPQTFKNHYALKVEIFFELAAKASYLSTF